MASLSLLTVAAGWSSWSSPAARHGLPTVLAATSGESREELADTKAVASSLAEPRSVRFSDVPKDLEPEAPEIGQRAPRVLLSGSTEQRVVALTFDLDMSPQMVWALRSGMVQSWVNQDGLSVLRENGVHATLFMTGLWAETYPELARNLATSGQFEIANHTYSHPAFHTPCYRLEGLGPGEMATELARSQEAIQRATGVTPVFFRFPGGCYDRAALDAVHAAGMIPVQWSVNSIDAFNPSAEQIASTVLGQVRPGAIVVMHLHGGPNAPASGAALHQIIPALIAQGYRFVTISELLSIATPVEPTDPREVVEFYQPPVWYPPRRCYPTPYRHC